MATVDILLPGMSIGTDQALLGLATITLIRGQTNTVVDVGHYGRRGFLERALESRGLTPDNIHTVVLTHAHWDHAGQNVELFPNARILIHPAELEYSRSPRKGDWGTPKTLAAMLEGLNLNVREGVEGTELEPGVSIIETHGHTRGHISVMVDTPDGTAVIAGDAVPDAGAARRGRPHLIFWNEREAEESLRRVLGLGGIIYPGHDRPFRIGPDGSAEYTGGVASLKVIAGFEQADTGAGVTIALEAIRQPFIHPEARG
ncbi:MAG: MBL fold metallo-hydrolase [Dehalococcoidia bacterium]